MLVAFISATYLSLAPPASVATAEAKSFGRTFASAPRTCAVLQAAYTAAINHKGPAFPKDVRVAARPLELGKFTLAYRSKLGLSRRDFDRLSGRQNIYSDPAFKPNCEWRGVQGPSTDNKGHQTYVTFTSPVFSNDDQLAIVEISFREEGLFGYGLICVARSTGGTWSARCLNSWIT